jgi:glycosyltransferase involved in cell wall biosynthesis
VLLANWNGARFLNEAIGSVVAQSYEDWEMIAVDTGSDDDSCAVMRSWAARDDRIRPLLFAEKMHCPPALNLGLASARGQFVARIESDDVWLPERLGAQIEFMDSAGGERAGVCGCDVFLLDEWGHDIALKQYPRTHADCLRGIWYRNPFCHSAVLIRKEALDDVGGYDQAFTLVEDLELWFRLGRCRELRNVPLPLVRYRFWQGSLTSRKLRALAWRAFVVRMRAAPRLGYHPPPLARAYSAASLAAAMLPPLLVRRLFERGLRGWPKHPAPATFVVPTQAGHVLH